MSTKTQSQVRERLTCSQEKSRDEICIILSNLFIDRDLSRGEIACMGDNLRRLDASSLTLDDVLYHDLFPILHSNLLGPSGIWTAFDEQWLLGQIDHQREIQLSYIQRLYYYILWLVLGCYLIHDLCLVKHALENPEKIAYPNNAAYPDNAGYPADVGYPNHTDCHVGYPDNAKRA
ncbi:hypothetical protein EV127DRAFT_129159 [Xylaria flabelliformis]|nr:hypothetical protein EV127DRAFT_129159 [Xylaria flabelliformis]